MVAPGSRLNLRIVYRYRMYISGQNQKKTLLESKENLDLGENSEEKVV